MKRVWCGFNAWDVAGLVFFVPFFMLGVLYGFNTYLGEEPFILRDCIIAISAWVFLLCSAACMYIAGGSKAS